MVDGLDTSCNVASMMASPFTNSIICEVDTKARVKVWLLKGTEIVLGAELAAPQVGSGEIWELTQKPRAKGGSKAVALAGGNTPVKFSQGMQGGLGGTMSSGGKLKKTVMFWIPVTA